MYLQHQLPEAEAAAINPDSTRCGLPGRVALEMNWTDYSDSGGCWSWSLGKVLHRNFYWFYPNRKLVFTTSSRVPQPHTRRVTEPPEPQRLSDVLPGANHRCTTIRSRYFIESNINSVENFQLVGVKIPRPIPMPCDPLQLMTGQQLSVG